LHQVAQVPAEGGAVAVGPIGAQAPVAADRIIEHYFAALFLVFPLFLEQTLTSFG
jgi:hypothetical protein